VSAAGLPEDLSELEDSDEAARHAADSLDRRMADLDLRNDLAHEQFAGPRWRRFEADLVRYGHAVLMAWMATGEIFSQCRKKSCYPGAPPEQWTREDRTGIANDTVAAAVEAFRVRALIGKRWDPTAGATLKTYFIGSCILQFPNHFRRWRTEEQTWNRLRRLEPGADELAHGRHVDAAEETVITRLTCEAAFDAIPDDRTKLAVLYRSMEYTVTEIAELLDTTPKAVEMLLRRQRRRATAPQNRRRSP
jgi:DNA-directed RNA polymerase specialized sigma24 family protein